MSQQLFTNLAIFILSLLVGFEVMSKIPATLQTPMMSGANAIHGVVVVGAFVIAAEANNVALYILAFLCAFFAAVNVAGGYTLTDRMLHMFDRPKASKNDDGGDK
ncbi:NAD(P)(+) transhydrogenase, alpha-2 subunit family protein [Agrilactobacillus composti DSM 18527 = JCM 14202]|jgi:NAD(P) transhydrogenase subunit alpha|uniref:proton-translocating NAD(P)(+) transhydrogenase n=1 Tax=Agrilactobacillus composti DSM 18527 = JCM 14202 TaxID=1423734 RepID=X0PCZ9_9LACO|nr:NAD(P) transhydrogenase subunit alpha [Agrilactobacillus composti]KRM33106.1 NAD(P)(+) transhydrogenase, alpha-2 subunit family protein [Agrilactobacillus composti DSM 18527 = JCM 14202]MCH4171419.1 proton-translocating transhydrogenase family protein [Lactobacillus sp.]GAF38538.1 NAD(P) transhydrogenase alpha subunit [Agrilactobacillus composti DSM 18527 = JCM 14202]